MLPGFEQNGFGMCAVTLKQSGTAIGTCGIFKRNPADDVELGFAFLPGFRGQGLALEAAAASMSYGWDTLKLTRIIAATNPDNHSSIRLLEKLGMRFEQMIFDAASKSDMKLFATSR
jgi:RimJ/RimL family protein N-acetyltransferase